MTGDEPRKAIDLAVVYARFPVLKSGRWPRLFACVALTAVVFTVLYLVAMLLTLLGVSLFTTHPAILNLLALIPSVLVLRDQKANAADIIGCVVLSWLAMLLAGAVFVIILWAAV